MTTLLVPETGRGRGTGHLRRCLKLLSQLPESLLYLPSGKNENRRGADELASILNATDAPEDAIRSRTVQAIPAGVDRVVIDMFDVSRETVLSFGHRMTVGLDVGGQGRETCSYLIDTLPRLDGFANVSSPTFLDLPARAPLTETAKGRILVTFGGEDSAGLTEKTVACLVGQLGVDPSTLTVVRPALRTLGEIHGDVEVLGPLPSIDALIIGHETTVCAFGLTAFEARAAGRRVVTIAPTPYHDRLARDAGFATAGVKTAHPGRLRAGIVQDQFPAPAAGGSISGIASLASVVTKLIPGPVGCPAHASERGEAVWRNGEKSYFVCPVCGTVYLERFEGDEEKYESSYFFEEYRRQYGKTYLEDFASIYETSARRLKTARRLEPEIGSVLDIGCAFGPFLKAADDADLEAFGIDVSDDAVEYVRETLGLKAVSGSVLKLNCEEEFGREQFDLVVLWYVIEHFRELSKLLGLLRSWVRPGGLLALATPNLCGVSGRQSADAFFAASPRDHHTIWHPASARLLLDEYGFDVRRIVSTGHHPERYRLVQKGMIPGWVARLHSRAFSWGDTFEIYATRRNDSEESQSD